MCVVQSHFSPTPSYVRAKVLQGRLKGLKMELDEAVRLMREAEEKGHEWKATQARYKTFQVIYRLIEALDEALELIKEAEGGEV